MEEDQPIYLIPKDNGNTPIQFDSKFKDFSNLVGQLNTQEEANVDITTEVLQIIKKFLEDHNYNANLIQVKKPLESSNPKDHMDQKSYELLLPFKGVENIHKMKPLIDAAYYLNIEAFKDVCKCMIACEFYIGPSEKELLDFQEKYGLAELTPEEDIQIMNEFAPAFEQLNKKFQQQLEEEQLVENR